MFFSFKWPCYIESERREAPGASVIPQTARPVLRLGHLWGNLQWFIGNPGLKKSTSPGTRAKRDTTTIEKSKNALIDCLV